MKVSTRTIDNYSEPQVLNTDGVVGFIFEIAGVRLVIKADDDNTLYIMGLDSDISIEPISSNVVLIRPRNYLSDDGWK